MSKVLLPRAIKTNRGDLASRWFFLQALRQYPHWQPVVFSQFEDDVPFLAKRYPYGPLRNAVPVWPSWPDVLQSDKVLWVAGLDLQDDSSLLKLVYMWAVFRLYRLLGKEIWCLFQGAGPITTTFGRWLSQRVLRQVSKFVARDPQSKDLVKEIAPSLDVVVGHDAIFLSEGEDSRTRVSAADEAFLRELFSIERPVIAVNLRLWFHFSSSVLPYQFMPNRYQARAEKRMQVLLERMIESVSFLRNRYDARVVLVSAYQPGLETWEDDLMWLEKVKKNFADDTEVILCDRWLSMPTYFSLMSRFDLVIGMRLHTTLIALRYGVPSINLNYTLKGRAILNHLGLGRYVIDLADFLQSPRDLFTKVDEILHNQEAIRQKIKESVLAAITTNDMLMEHLFQ